MNDLLHLLSLQTVSGVGPRRIKSLISHFGSAEAVLKADISDLCRVKNIDEKTAWKIKKETDPQYAEKQIALAEKYGVKIISYWDEGYPESLRKIYDPPVILYLKGNLNKKDNNSIAVVGTRSPTNYGRMVTEQICEGLVNHNITVVSGMARGIDSIAHQASLQNGGRTIAVLGSGIDIIYPPENRNLYLKIADSGCVISEFAISSQPEPAHFPRRNRIISGLALGTLVVEAGEKSGALITAYNALEQGREVFAIPGRINSTKSRGTHRLIKEGARLVERVEDIFSEIPEWRSKAGNLKSQIDPEKVLNPLEKRIWEILSSDEPKHIDIIAREAGINTSEASSLLLSMELKNCVKQFAGMIFLRK